MKKEDLYKNMPDSPGVYIMQDKSGEIIYIGKAANLKKRVSSYFKRPHDKRIESMVQKIESIDYRETNSALEALILEASLIKEYEPKFNIKEKDDRSFLWVKITDKEEYPRVILVRGTEKSAENDKKSSWYGPFTSSNDLKKALKILRKIFPYSTHGPEKIGTYNRPCTYAQINLCPGVCFEKIDKKDYMRNIRGLKGVLSGKKKKLIKDLEKEMKVLSKAQEFEKADIVKKQIFALQHIQDVSLISDTEIINEGKEGLPDKNKKRVEGYDISNISGTSSVGSMVVLSGSNLDKSSYRKFKIQTIKKQDDVGMLKEVISRRLNHEEWPLPDLILVDGGKGQVNGVKEVVEDFGLELPVIGIAKGSKRKKNEFIGEVPGWVKEEDLIKLRDEAHRFAVQFHKKIRSKASGI
ncbi:MAG: GIY-YIG nuclease family protein [Candidatus Paceibacterota bacterium]